MNPDVTIQLSAVSIGKWLVFDGYDQTPIVEEPIPQKTSGPFLLKAV